MKILYAINGYTIEERELVSIELRVKPHSDESLYSFLFRNAETYGFTHLHFMLPKTTRRFSIMGSNLNYYKEAIWINELFELGKSLGVNAETHVLNQFDELLFNKKPTKSEREQYYTSESTRFCLQCMKENYYYRLIWDIKLVTVCTDHNCFLMEKCARCGRRVTVSRLMQRYCLCGAHFMDSEILGIPLESIVDSQKIIQGLLLRNMKQIVTSNGCVLNPSDYFYLFNLLSRILDYFPGDHPIFKGTNLKISRMNFMANSNYKYNQSRDIEMHSILCESVHKLIVNPEVNFSSVLETVQEMSAGKEIGRFRSKRKDLRSLVNQPNNSAYLDVYEHLLTEENNSYVLKNNIFSDIDAGSFVAMRRAGIILSISRRELDRLVNLEYLEKVNTGKSTLITRKSIDSWVEKRDTLLDVYQVADMMGLKPLYIREIAKKLIVAPYRGPNIDGYKQWLFEKETVYRFMSEIFENALPFDPTLEWISFQKFYYSLKPLGTKIIDTFELLKSELFSISINSYHPNFKGLYILQADLEQYLRKLSSDRIEKFGYTITDVMKILSCSKSYVINLVETGSLRFTSEWMNSHGTLSYYFDPEVIDEYVQQTLKSISS